MLEDSHPTKPQGLRKTNFNATMSVLLLLSRMIRKAFVMFVNEGQEGEYERRHQPIWPELEAALLAHGVTNYSIFLHAGTRQLFGYAEIESDARWAAIALTEVCQRWWASMKELMPAHPDGRPVAVDLAEVFHIEAVR